MTDRLKTVFRFGAGFVPDNTYGGEADGSMLFCQALWVRMNGRCETFSGVRTFAEPNGAVTFPGPFTFTPPNVLTCPAGAAAIFEKGMWLLIDNNIVPVARVLSDTQIELADVPLFEPLSTNPVVQTMPTIVEVDDFRCTFSRGSVRRYLSGTLLGVGYGRVHLNGNPVRSPGGPPGPPFFDLKNRLQIAVPEPIADQSIYRMYDAGMPGFWPADASAGSGFPGTFTVTAGTGGKNSPGLYSLRLTRIRSATGGESNPTDPVEVTLAADGKATITAWPPVWPGQTAWGVFMTPEPLPAGSTDQPGPWFRWAEDIPINPDGTTNSHDFTWISQELEGSDLLEFDNDPPPDASYVAVLDDIVILCGTEGRPDPITQLPTNPGPGVRPSKPLNPEAFPASYGSLVGPPEDIVGVVEGVGRIYLGTRNRIHIGTLTGNQSAPLQVRPFWTAGICNTQQLVFVNGELYGYTGFGPTRSAGDGAVGAEEHTFGARVAIVTRNWVRERVRVAYDPQNKAVIYFHAQDQKNIVLLPDGTITEPVWMTMALPFMLETQVWSGIMLIFDPLGQNDFHVSGAATVDGHVFSSIAGSTYVWDEGGFGGLIGYGAVTPFVDGGEPGLFKTLTAMSLTSHGKKQQVFIWKNNIWGSDIKPDFAVFPKDNDRVLVAPWAKLNVRNAKTFCAYWAGFYDGNSARHEINEIVIESILERAHH